MGGSERDDQQEEQTLPWATWPLAFALPLLGLALSTPERVGPAGVFLPVPIGLLLVHWWGKRVLAGMLVTAVAAALVSVDTWSTLAGPGLPSVAIVAASHALVELGTRGRTWLPTLEDTLRFLFFGLAVPVTLGVAYGALPSMLLPGSHPVPLAYAIGVQWTSTMLGCLLFTVPALVVLSWPMQQRGWTLHTAAVHELVFPRSDCKRWEMVAMFAVLSAVGATLPIRDYALVYGTLVLICAIRFRIGVTLLATVWSILATGAIAPVLVGVSPYVELGEVFHEHLGVLSFAIAALVTSRILSDTRAQVTRRRESDQIAHDMRARLAEAQQIARVGSWVLDPDTKEMWWSAQMHRLMQSDEASIEQLIGSVHADASDGVGHRLRAWLDGNDDEFSTEYRVTLPDGSSGYHATVARRTRDDDGHTTSIRGTTQDISEPRRLDAERARLLAQIQETQKLDSLGKLAGGLAHDFNNLLVGIQTHAELLRLDESLDEPQRRLVEHLTRASERAGTLVQQMMSYALQGPIERQRLNLTDHVRAMRAELATATPMHVTLHEDWDLALPTVRADPHQVHQAVWHLVRNAIEALGIQPGTIWLRTRRTEIDADEARRLYPPGQVRPGSYVALEVHDDGPGIDPESRARVFDPFHTTKATCQGLGLSLVLGIVRSHGGGIDVQCPPGQGTSVRLLFPALGSVPEATPTTARSAPALMIRGGTILVVDDVEVVRAATRNALECYGFDVLVACGGEEAVEIFREKAATIDCVLLDMNMPDIDGRETFDRMRAIDPDVCTILTSGSPESETADRFTSGGLAGFIQKPYALEELIGLFDEVLATRTSGDAAR